MTWNDSTKRFAILACVSILMCGCSKSFPLAKMSGRITLDGEPLAGASINTQPVAKENSNPGPGSWAKTDEQGRYALELVSPALPGAIVGEHRVTITRYGYSTDPTDDSGNAAQLKWPSRYTDGSLRLTVPETGTENANFDLTTE